jgi:hypothetical protein
MKKQREDGVLKVVHQDKLKTFLENLEMLDEINASNVKCKFCKTIITLDNINGIFPESNTVKISCDKPECVVSLTEYLNEKNA